ncbi:MAG: glycosyltransferase [Clostridia bacterium]|nr:glycosyltransferase [Clostridia bacterium]
MNSFQRRWNMLKVAWREEKFYGLKKLMVRHFMLTGDFRTLRRMYASIRRMEERHAQTDPLYHEWFMESIPGEDECALQARRAFSHRVSFLIPTFNTRPDLLRALAESLRQQTCDAWEACFYDGNSTNEETRAVLGELSGLDSRFHVLFGRENLGISGNTNKALMMAQTDIVALCDHDDLLARDAVYWILDACENGAELFYSDEDKCTEEGDHFFDPHLKADFAPDALRSGNYMCHVMGMTTALLRSLGGLRSECDGSQDHDLALRASEKAKCIAHIPRVLYHWRMLHTSFSHAAEERCANAAARAVQGQVERLQLGGSVSLNLLQPEIEYRIPEDTRVTLILHGMDHQLNLHWLKTVLDKTGLDLERIQDCILLCDAMPAKKRIPAKAQGWTFRSAKNTMEAAHMAQGQVLLFLEQGMRPLEDVWLHRMLMMATRPWIAEVGGGIVDRNTEYLACGYAVDVPHGAVGCFYGENCKGHTFQLYDRLVRDVTAVSMCHMMIRRELFLKLEGFGTYHSDLGSVALGLHAMQHGLYNVTVPHSIMRTQGHTQVLSPQIASGDLPQFIEEFGTHPVEHFSSPHFEKEKGSMTVDLNRHSDVRTVYTRFDGM